MNYMTKNSKLNQSDILKLIKCFAVDLSASQTASLLGINRNTINRYFNEIMLKIFAYSDNDVTFAETICEVDESYFGEKRSRGKAGRGVLRKVIVFGIIERNGNVYTEIVCNAKSSTIVPIIQSKCATSCLIYSDEWKAYNVLKTLGYDHNRIKHSSGDFASGFIHTNSIESYWSYCKSRLAKFYGLNRTKYHLHIKECEYRFNNRNKDLFDSLKKLLSNFPLFQL